MEVFCKKDTTKTLQNLPGKNAMELLFPENFRNFRSSPPKVFLGEGILKMYSTFA